MTVREWLNVPITIIRIQTQLPCEMENVSPRLFLKSSKILSSIYAHLSPETL